MTLCKIPAVETKASGVSRCAVRCRKDSRMKCWFFILLLVVAPLGATEAPQAPHWAFQPVREPALPAVTRVTWCSTPVDQFILARLESGGSAPAPSADRRTLIRRASFDLTGLPPSAAEIDAFATDPAPDAYPRLIDRLLDSPRYGEHWGRHWLDVVRYADTAGETADYPVPVAWRYRNWVIDAFNSDQPYDEFLREQIAGDILARSGPRERYAARVTATGFLAMSRRFGFDSENYHHLTIQDTLDTLGQSVLGLSLGCARCHAHKFDPISMTDYYGMYGIFESTRYAFPGSEQKQRVRALAPLVPPEESQPLWRAYEDRVAALAAKVERQNLAVPGAILRSLDDFDGDFELQAPAAGGSRGVLVAPWVYDGGIAVTTDAQSPFKNLHPSGRVGVSVPARTNAYRLMQVLHPAHPGQTGGVVHVNLDFALATNDTTAMATHRFWLGTQPEQNGGSGHPVVEIILARDTIALRSGGHFEPLRTLRAGEWHNLQLVVDPGAGVISGSVGVPGDVTAIVPRRLDATWSGRLNQVVFESVITEGGRLPGLRLDNLGVQDSPVPPVSTTSPVFAAAGLSEPDAGSLAGRLRELVGLDGDFELQRDDTPPSVPWGPGPDSVVRIRTNAQSPFRNIYPAGSLGVSLPGGGHYNGFGQTLARKWQAGSTPRIHAAFDFRCSPEGNAVGGTWRYYLGHDPGRSAAVELFIGCTQLFQRDSGEPKVVALLRPGEWYQVRLTLDPGSKTFEGTLSSVSTVPTRFSGTLAPGWDGVIDYTFIDSYGQPNGERPALQVDNFALSETPLPALDAPPVVQTAELHAQRRQQVEQLRQEQARRVLEAEAARRELETLLAEGPFELAYAVSDGTPRNSRLQQRGEPDRPAGEVPRGFLPALGGGLLPADTSGSGRLELAGWLTSPTNPLTARVMVNRIWQYHFGRGLVKTPNDFGIRGQRPSHPELLDYLATQFVRSGWSVKAMHRLIMLSAVYRQRSSGEVVGERAGPHDQPSESGSGEDCPVAPMARTGILRRDHVPAETPGADDFSPFPRRRLGAEETRDAILKVSGELDLTPGRHHPFPAPTGWAFTQHGPFGAVYEHNRRSVYLMTQRIKRHPFLALFDGADPNASTAERRITTVPTQALFFLNDPFVHDNAARMASRVMAVGGDETQAVEVMYRRVLARAPAAGENAGAKEFLSAYRAELLAMGAKNPEAAALAAFIRVLMGSNEFLTVD